MATHDISAIVRESVAEVMRPLMQRMDDIEKNQREREQQMMNHILALNDQVKILAELQRTPQEWGSDR